MIQPTKPKKRRLKPKYRGAGVKQMAELLRLRRRVAELEKKLEGGWVSDDGVWCDIVYAARRVGRSEQRLRNMKSEHTGPMVYDKSGSVRYKIAELDRWLEEGWGLRNVLEEKA
ncbi:hypothetical protein N4R57_10310 [Rhodobacteraceae bacterium D3-12]|nr:hypothetical protein N4R57_10310 [Rhodobacteraceae bacterium D3-12]